MIVFSYIVMALICGLFPLVNVFGYESSAVFGVFATIVVLCTVEMPYKKQSRMMWWLAESRRQLLYLQVVPLVYVVHALRIRNCDWLTGVEFWLVIPCVSVMVTLALVGIFSGDWFKRKRLWVAGLLLLDLLFFGFRLAWWPPIAGYSIGFGWFAGSIYDEALSLSTTLLLYRFHLLLGSVLGLLMVDRYHQQTMVKNFALLVVCCLQCLTFLKFDQPSVFRSTNWVKAELGAELETEHFVVYFDPSDIDQQMETVLEADLEFRYWEMQEFFQDDPVAWKGRKIEVFLYPDASTQQRLIGSRQTFVARPWTHQIHVRWRFGSEVMAHELSHIFSAVFGGWLFSLPAYENGMPNIGLLEGVAVAADWPQEDFTPHEIAASLYQEGQLPNIRNSFDPVGFWKSPAGKAYQGVGSFVRWLIDEYGIQSVKSWYQGVEFYDIFGIRLLDAVARWESFLDGVDLNKYNKKQILNRYNRRSIFQKKCARTVAEQERLVMKLFRQRRDTRAIQELETLLQWKSSPRMELLFVKKQMKYSDLDLKRVGIALEEYQDDRTYSQWQDMWTSYLYDNNRKAEAISYLEELEDWNLSEGWFRHFWIKRAFMKRDYPLDYFDDQLSSMDRISWLISSDITPSLRDYLLVIQLGSHHQWKALSQFSISEDLPPILQQNMTRILFESALQEENLERAESLLPLLAEHKKFQEYTDRVQFLRTYGD